MPTKYNPFTSRLDYTGGSDSWADAVNTEASLPLTDSSGVGRTAKDTDSLYLYDTTTSKWIKQRPSIGTYSGTSTANGLTIDNSTTGNVTSLNVTLHSADGTNPGAVSTTTQSFAGNKTFLDSVTINNTLTLSSTMLADAGVDVTATGGTDTLSLGVNNADVINIGRSGAIVNIIGTTNFNNVTNYQVSDKNITLNKGGSTGSGSASGLEIEENSLITGYNQTSADRNSWELKAPNTAGIATITPGASGITLDQSSHDPVTVSDTNSVDLTLSTQNISADLRLSSNAADAGSQLVNLNIESTSSVGLRAQILDTAIRSTLSVLDTNSIDMSYNSSTGVFSSDLRLSANAADANFVLADTSIQSTSSLGLRVQVQYATGLVAGVVSTGAQTLAGSKTFTGTILADSGVDVTATGGTDTLSLGATSADQVYIGRTASTTRIVSATHESVAKSIVLNKTGAAASGDTSGLEVEEDGTTTGYNRVSSDRNSWELKAPNTAGVATITPGAGGITLNQSSHDPATVSDTNSIDLTLTGQNISADLRLSSNAADSGFVIVTNNIESTSSVGLRSQVQVTALTTALDPIYVNVAGDTMTGNLHMATQSAVRFEDSTGGEYVGLRAPGTVSATYTLTLPTAVAPVNNSALVSDTSGNLSYVTITASSSNDIAETSFTAADNQAVAANVTGLSFSNAAVRSFIAQLSIVRGSTYAVYELAGIQKGASWEMSQTLTGDDTGLTFTITTAGQVQYVSSSTGNTALLKFRAMTTSV